MRDGKAPSSVENKREIARREVTQGGAGGGGGGEEHAMEAVDLAVRSSVGQARPHGRSTLENGTRTMFLSTILPGLGKVSNMQRLMRKIPRF